MKISPFVERIPTGHNKPICSSKSKLFYDPFGICSRVRDIFKRPPRKVRLSSTSFSNIYILRFSNCLSKQTIKSNANDQIWQSTKRGLYTDSDPVNWIICSVSKFFIQIQNQSFLNRTINSTESVLRLGPKDQSTPITRLNRSDENNHLSGRLSAQAEPSQVKPLNLPRPVNPLAPSTAMNKNK